MRTFRPGLACRLALLALLAVPLLRLAAQGIPDRLSNTEFWHMFADFSEPNGTFSSENLLSNETGFQNVIPELLRTVKPGGVYVGVGPEQNFTYIAALRPRMAFICDIRHQNGVYHLLYKALIEMSDNRVDFLSKLFSRPRPAGLSNNVSVDSLFSAYLAVAHDSALYDKTLAAVKDHLMKDHGFALSADELSLLEGNFDALYWNGPDLSYSVRTVNAARTTTNGGFGGGRGGRGGGFVNYTALMTATDNAGVKRSYLANEANYQVLRDLEMRNMLVPVTGDFGNGTALRNIGDYVRKQGGTVTTFYTSNAEQYVFGAGNWFKFEAAVATFPLDSTSTFIRSGRPGMGGGGGMGRGAGGGMSQSLLQSMQWLVKAVADGKIQGYQDVLNTSH